LTFVVPQSTSRDLPLRQHVVKFPAATRFDTLWARWSHSTNACDRPFIVGQGTHIADGIAYLAAMSYATGFTVLVDGGGATG
jgi:hypothetical protein